MEKLMLALMKMASTNSLEECTDEDICLEDFFDNNPKHAYLLGKTSGAIQFARYLLELVDEDRYEDAADADTAKTNEEDEDQDPDSEVRIIIR